nr:MAG TPA: hypothetical protein [Caudoviricetes sp.]
MYMYQWDNNVRIADRLFHIAEQAGNDSGLKDGAERAAIGRLYYACYNMANDIVLDHYIYRNNVPQYNGGSHERIINALSSCPTNGYSEEEIAEIIQELIDLKGYRHHADYVKRSPISEDEIKIAKELYQKLRVKLFNF